MKLYKRLGLLGPLFVVSYGTLTFNAQTVYDEQNRSFWQEKGRGWHWYESVPEEESQPPHKKPNKKEEKEDQNATSPYQKKLKSFQQSLEEAKAKALMKPTEQNILAYQKKQQEAVNMSHAFAEGWQKNLQKYPFLDGQVDAPMNQRGVKVTAEIKRQENERLLKEAAEDYGLFFVYRASCPYCQEMAPVVKEIATRFGWEVLGIKGDSVSLPSFPDSEVDNGFQERFGITHVPAVLLFNKNEETLTPVSYGLRSMDQFITLLTKSIETVQDLGSQEVVTQREGTHDA